MKATVTTFKDDINHLVVRFFLFIFISLSLNMCTSRLARPLTFFIEKWLNLTGIMGFTFLFPLVSPLTSGAASQFILHEQNLYQISSNSFLVYANSPGGDKPRPYNWWWVVPTQTLLVATLGSIPLIFRLQSPSAFRMVGYIV